MRPVPLKVKPVHRSPTLRMLHPPQKLLMIRKKHKWLYVECLDYDNEVLDYGWVDKKYLRRIELLLTSGRVTIQKRIETWK